MESAPRVLDQYPPVGRPTPPAPPIVIRVSRPRLPAWVNLVFFLMTVVATLVAGTLLTLDDYTGKTVRDVILTPGLWTIGLPYSLSLILILGSHEMGHYVLGHIWKGFAFLAALLFVLLYLGYRTIGWVLARSGARWEVRGLEDWASLPALLLLLSVFSFASNAFGSSFSRYQENQADVYGLEVTRGIISDPGQACAQSFQNFGETALVDPDPNPVQVFLFYDHPTVASRIHLCVTYDPWSKGESPQFVH